MHPKKIHYVSCKSLRWTPELSACVTTCFFTPRVTKTSGQTNVNIKLPYLALHVWDATWQHTSKRFIVFTYQLLRSFCGRVYTVRQISCWCVHFTLLDTKGERGRNTEWHTAERLPQVTTDALDLKATGRYGSYSELNGSYPAGRPTDYYVSILKIKVWLWSLIICRRLNEVQSSAGRLPLPFPAR